MGLSPWKTAIAVASSIAFWGCGDLKPSIGEQKKAKQAAQAAAESRPEPADLGVKPDPAKRDQAQAPLPACPAAPASPAAPAVVERELAYEADVRPIIEAKCASCHGRNAVRLGRPTLNTYSTLIASIDGAIGVVESGIMPPATSGLTVSPQELETLKTWNAQGALQFPIVVVNGGAGAIGTTPTEPVAPQQQPQTPTVTYNADIKKLLEARCTSCHNGTVSPPDLRTLALARTNSARALVRMTAAAAPMPPAGQLGAAEISLFQKWVGAGMLEGDPAPTAAPVSGKDCQ